MSRVLTLILVSALAGAIRLEAQEGPAWSGALSLAQGTASLKDLTGQSLGFSLDAAYDGGEGLPYRFGLAYTAFSDGTQSRTLAYQGLTPVQAEVKGPSLNTAQLLAALRLSSGPDWSFYLGLTANRHRLGSDLAGKGGGQSVKGVKLGFRADVEYKVTPRLAAVATFQAAELGVDAAGSGSLNPSWFQAGARWRF